MKISTRVTAAASVACAAIALPAVALAATAATGTAGSSSAASTASAPPACTTSQLTGWMGVPGDGTAGGTYYQLELSNTSGSACTLLGYPGVSALGTGGHQLGSAASRSSSHPSHLITVSRGGTVHVELRIANVGAFPQARCHPKAAASLRVFPPNDRSSLTIPFRFTACSKRGPVYLGVTATVSGAGIPGYSH